MPTAALAGLLAGSGRTRAQPRHALLVLRSHSRVLVGSARRTAAEITTALCGALGSTPLHVANFDAVPLKEQARLTALASVMIAVHGAQLTNLIWMDEGAAVLEVTSARPRRAI